MGSSGLSVSRLALGTMTWGRTTDEEGAREQLRTFLDAGGTLVDTAHGYSDGTSEEIIGRLIDDDVQREDLVICTKSGISRRSGHRVVDTSRHSLLSQLDTSLERLGTDHVDLWLVHTWSDEAPLSETLSALEWAVSTGRARYVGVSNFSGWQVARAMSLLEQARVPLVANEIEYSLTNRSADPDLLAAAQALGFGLLPYSPLGRGFLTGKLHASTKFESTDFRSGLPRFTPDALKANQGLVDSLGKIAAAKKATSAQIALAWLLAQKPWIVPIPGTTKRTRLQENLGAAEIQLTADDLREIDRAASQIEVQGARYPERLQQMVDR